MNPDRLRRRDFLGVMGVATAAAMRCGRAGASSKRPPNLLFVFADQLGRNHCGYAGAQQARTPCLDRLAAQGADFFNAVSTMPVCAAFRASLMTGKYPTSTGMVINELRMNPCHECFGHVLTRGGYETGYIGKWHLYANQLGHHHDPKNSFVPPGPNRLGFDGYWAAYNFHHEYYRAYYHTDSEEKLSYGDGVYEPDGQTELALDFIRRSAPSEKPFALFLSYGTPHDPWSATNVPAAYRAMFRDAAIPNPPNYQDKNDPYADQWGRLSPGQRRQLEAWRRNYYAMTANLDWNIGRLLGALDEAGLTEETLVVFTSDHGEMFGAQGRRAKNIFYEEAARVPFLMRWPGVIPEGAASDACLSTVDILPTVLSLLGLPVPQAAEGMDLSACARGVQGPEPEAALLQNTGACAAWEDGHEWRALRDKRFTYAIYRVDRSEHLYDNQKDPYQMTNLAGDPAHTGRLEGCRTLLAERLAALNDGFAASTWYRDHWIADRIILRGAKG